VQAFTGIAADREESNAAGADADGGTLQQCANVVSSGWRCWLAHAREARVNAGVDFLVDLLEERCHHRVAVLRAQFIVRRSGGVDFLAVQGGVTHAETVALSAQASHQPDGCFLAGQEGGSCGKHGSAGAGKVSAVQHGLPGRSPPDLGCNVHQRRWSVLAVVTRLVAWLRPGQSAQSASRDTDLQARHQRELGAMGQKEGEDE